MDELSHLPCDWQKINVSSVADVIDPHPSHRAPDEDPLGIPFAGIGDLDESGKIRGNKVRRVSPEIYEEHSKRYQITANTIGFGRVASIGKIIDFKGLPKKITISPTLALIEPNRIEKNFLIQALKSQDTQLQINLLLTGSTRSSLGIALLRNLIIPFPKLPEQQKIATILSSVDDVIEKTRAQIDKLKDLKTGMMQELLTKGIGHTEFKDSPVGRIPHSWDIFQLSQLARIGSSKRILQSEYVEEGVPFYRSKEVIRRSKGLEIENTLYISVDRFLELSDKFGSPKKGDILITAVGTIGTVYLVEDREFYFKDGNLLWLRDIKAKVSSEYLAKIMQSEQFQDYIKRVIGGSSQSALTIEKLAELHVLLPRKEEQYQIVSILSSIESKYYLAMNKLNTLKSVKKALMQDLLTGKVRVKTQKDMLKNVE